MEDVKQEMSVVARRALVIGKARTVVKLAKELGEVLKALDMVEEEPSAISKYSKESAYRRVNDARFGSLAKGLINFPYLQELRKQIYDWLEAIEKTINFRQEECEKAKTAKDA